VVGFIFTFVNMGPWCDLGMRFSEKLKEFVSLNNLGGKM